MRKTCMEMLRYLFLPNTLYLGYRNVRQDYISHPIPHCGTLAAKKDASGFLVIKFRRRCRKSQWRRRYCVIYDKELFLYKDQTGKSEDMETCRINLRHVLEFDMYTRNMASVLKPISKKKPSKPIKTQESIEPICYVTIFDEKRRKYELGLIDEKDAIYWINRFYSAFYQARDASTTNPDPCHCQLPKSKPHPLEQPDYRSYFVRSKIEETRTFVVRSTLVMERNIDDEQARKTLHERHWTAQSQLFVDDNLLAIAGKSPVVIRRRGNLNPNRIVSVVKLAPPKSIKSQTTTQKIGKR